MSAWLGTDAGHHNRWEAEKIAIELHETLLTTARTVCVHDVNDHHAMSFMLPLAPSEAVLATLVAQGFGVASSSGFVGGPEMLRLGAAQAVSAHKQRREGRALRFPGQRSLRGRHGVSDILAFSAIEQVLPHGITAVDTRGNLQPFFRDGKLVLEID
ncbi:hypothetical protein Lesp02_25480 [Lentzea sp. NBRC 105346]|uniref:hypothetical protein n=1 Tax=Lentzea sp. NBRC 105346 TaxID=3032205 RepID=UPI002554DA94|nr:hypothetical protein [Lentzea sp. NBRC 105346]GLZ30359.1 hypothetical protein Lesp02_25480 [Lentzea sp. NBRC 105346]